jgi:hypothetical protein
LVSCKTETTLYNDNECKFVLFDCNDIFLVLGIQLINEFEPDEPNFLAIKLLTKLGIYNDYCDDTRDFQQGFTKL